MTSTETSRHHFRVGDRVEKYTVEGVLGEGGVARVYQVRHRTLRTAHALKVLTKHEVEVRARLLLEGRVQAQLRHHNIVAVTDVIETPAGVGLVLEFVEGDALDELLSKKRLNLTQIDRIASGVFDGVAHAHSRGLVHRDLKPANILLHIEGRTVVPKVSDFGLVMTQDGLGSFREGEAMGTPRYMCPEQVRDSGAVDQRADIFALGAILYEMLTGQAAFAPHSSDLLKIFQSIEAGRYVPVRALRRDVPRRMADAVHRALSPDPEDRPFSVDELRSLWFATEEEEPDEVGPLVAVMQRYDSLGSQSLAGTLAFTPAGVERSPRAQQEERTKPVDPWGALLAVKFGAVVGSMFILLMLVLFAS